MGQGETIPTAIQRCSKKYYDRNVVPSKIAVGDRVYKFDPKGKKGLTTKLMKHWIGPYEVLDVTPTNALIRLCRSPLKKPSWTHLNWLKIFYGPGLGPNDSAPSSENEDQMGENLNMNQTPIQQTNPIPAPRTRTATNSQPVPMPRYYLKPRN